MINEKPTYYDQTHLGSWTEGKRIT